MELLEKFNTFTGLNVNAAKSCFVTGKQRSQLDGRLRSVTKFHKRDLPFIYLGCPMYKDRTTMRIFNPIIDKMKSRIQGWKGKLLSLGAKFTLIKSVLQSMPLDILSLINPPMGAINIMNKLMRNFFW